MHAATTNPSSGKRAALAALERQVRRVQARHRAVHGRLSSGWQTLDNALGGGWLLGGLHELIEAAPGLGAGHLALHAAARALWHNNPRDAAKPDRLHDRWVVQLDPRQTFYPLAALHAGIPMERLVVVRPRNSADMLWATEQLLRCRTVAAVIAPVRSLEPRAARRLQLAAEAGGGLGLLLRSGNASGASFAASRLRIIGDVPHANQPSLLHPSEDVQTADEMIGMRIAVLKLKEGRAGAELVLRLPVAPYAAPAPAPHRVHDRRVG